MHYYSRVQWVSSDRDAPISNAKNNIFMDLLTLCDLDITSSFTKAKKGSPTPEKSAKCKLFKRKLNGPSSFDRNPMNTN